MSTNVIGILNKGKVSVHGWLAIHIIIIVGNCRRQEVFFALCAVILHDFFVEHGKLLSKISVEC